MSAESERSLPPGRIPDRRAGGRLLGAEPGAVRAFTAAWAALDDLPTTDRAARAPRIADYLPDARTLRVEALVELIRVDLRHRWLRPAGSLPDRRKRLDDYCAEFPELDRDELPAGLIYEEFVVRRHSGERLDPRDCLREYPVQAPALRELLNADDLDQSTRRARPDELGEASAPDTTLSATAPATPAADTAPGRAAAPDSGWDDDITVLAPGQPATPPVDDTTRRGPGPDPRRTPQSPPDTTVAAPDPRTATTRVASGADQPGPTDDITLLPHTGGAADTPAAEHAVNPATGPARTSDMDATAAATRAAPDATGTEATGTATAIGFDGDDRLDPLDRIRVGQRVDDFDLLTGLGSGAFARVFLARQRSMQRLVAVKISADHGTEAQTLAQLDHDYIVRVFDQRLMDSQRGTGESARRLRLLYMQFLPGGTLLGVLRWVRATPPAERSGKLLLDAVDAAMEEKGEIRPTDSSVRAEIAGLSWPETVAWLGRRLAEALAYASSHGVLHRDVKPANVLLTAEAVPKLADFNISFSRNVEGTSPVAYFGGSLAYMSPEQLEACHPGWERSAADLDTRADIFSLGVVLWELLTGAKPFDDSTAGAGRRGDDTTLEAMLERRSLGVDPAALDRVPPDCPAALRRVLLTCLEPDRERRWAGGDVLAKQLDLCLDQRARELVDPKPGSWRLRLRPWIVPVLLVAIGLPNLLASLYNIQHNQTLIVARMTEDAQRTFLIITGVVNSVFFPLGFVVVAYMSRYVLSVPRGLRRGRRYDPDTLRRARCDALLLGERAVAIPFSLWVLAGLTFPLALRLSTGGITASAVIHFLASLVVCGAIAASYPFFLATFYIVRCIYPIFLRHGEISADDAVRLRALDRRCNGYLAIAASVPLLAVAGVTFLPPGDIPQVIVAVRVLCVGGIVAFVASYLLFRALEADLQALERVVSPDSARGPDPEPPS
ncbi:protein kinase [Nocardia farcinica]|uniref:serine/threonine-protein kinase n=2 Tax=Nocardia farcinica TaxID=37329 RepID=UPI0018939214|nr:serine/threonine-protein kinase [Nocardia farcinica]MBF6262548.1 protein kinase [Nocardia farcinica]MBF6281052.1 protein kinase [Nocardia farcinica]MBF6306152.1 protein kinase [Nocardia farcinica]MBF6389620.1 protein kinase [Nocardia farcinica]MBF6491007.1 protein kinase [Nocardia farcinica]